MKKWWSFSLFILSVTMMVFMSCATRPPRLTPGDTMHKVEEWSGIPEVQIRYGILEGYSDRENTWAWKGIPYAKPPVGHLRWKPPEDPDPWEGTLTAKRFGPWSVQHKPVGKRRVTGDEDCLYLNVWRPQTGETGLPVYVWIHGGGNSTGSADYTREYYGYHLAARCNAVYVSINYRLGPFGWFTHPSLRELAEDPLEASGNFGTLDIIQSLKWIRENITAFGGDPNNVTVAGESGGGINVCSLLISPEAEGLFHRGIIRSGGFVMSSIEEGDISSEAVLMKMLRKKNRREAASLRSSMTSEEIMQFLRSLSARQIQKSYTAWSFGMIEIPVLFRDGRVIPEAGSQEIRTGTYPSKVPIMVGSNTDEIKLFMYWDKKLRKNKPFYGAVTGYGSDMWKVNGVDAFARQLVRHEEQPPVYAYLFNWGSLDGNGKSVLARDKGFYFGACHALEIPFFAGFGSDSAMWGLLFFDKKNSSGVEDLTDAVMAYQKSFLWHGHTRDIPDTMPEWLPWSEGPGEPKYMILDADLTTRELTMSSRELTEDSVLARLKTTYGPEISAEAVAFSEEEGINFQRLE